MMAGNNQFRSPSLFTGVMKSGSKDPRQLLRNRRGYNPTYQADQQQFYNLNQDQYNNTIPLEDAVGIASQSFPSQSRIQVDYIQHNGIFPATPPLTQILLIPRNLNRSGFYIVDLTTSLVNLYITFGKANISSNSDLGFPLLMFNTFAGSIGTFAETNGVIAIDDIYFHTTTGGNPNVKLYVLEGIPRLGK